MSNERNLISDQVITNRAPVRNQDNKHAKKVSDGTMSFMVWSITGTALAACSGPIFGDGTSIGGGGGRSGGNGGIPAPENGASALIGDTQFGSVPEAGGVYIRPEVQNEAGDVQAAEIMFRRGDLPDGTGDARLSEASTAGQLGAPDTPIDATLTDFVATHAVGSATFYFVSFANLERLVLDPDNNYEGAERNFGIRFLVYDGVDGTFTDDIAPLTPDTLASAVSTVNVVFEAVDDPATAIALGSNPMTSLPEDTSAALRATRTEIATFDLTGDPDGGDSGTLEIVEVAGTDDEMFEIEGNVLYLSAGTNLDFETSPTLNVRVGLEGTTVVENVVVTVTNVEGEPGDFDDYATGIELASSPTPVRTLPEDPDTEPARGTRIDIATLVLTGDPDGGNSGTLQRAGTHAAMFDLDGNVLYLRADAALDFEDFSTLDISVRLMEVPSVSVDVDVTVTDVVEGIPAMEEGANALIEASRFGTVPADGGIYIKAEVQNAADVQGAQIMFRPDGANEDGTGDLTLAMALTNGELGSPSSPPGDFVATRDIEPVTNGLANTFYFVAASNINRLVLNPNEDHDVSGTFQIRFLGYDGGATTFTDDIATATLASASTVPVAFEAVDDAVTAIAIEVGTTPVASLAENVGGTVTTRTKIADLAFTDDDDTPPEALEIVVTDDTLDSAVVASIIALFEIDVDELYLVAGERLDFETVPALPIRVQSVADSTIGVNIPVMVTDEVEVNIPPTSMISDTEEGAATIANDRSETATTVILFDDADDGDPNDGLTIRGDASASSTEVPTTPEYADGFGTDLPVGTPGTIMVEGTYGRFVIVRNDSNGADGSGTLSVTYELNTMPHTDVESLVTGEELFEKLTVYVHDGDNPSIAQDFVVTIEGPAANSVPTSMIMAGSEGTATVANDNTDEISASTMITFDDAESANSALTIRGYASSGSDTRPTYDSNSGELTSSETMVTGTYGDFTIARDDTAGTLRVEYNLNEDHDDVRVAGFDLVERLTVYVNDGEDTSTAQDFVVTIDRPVLTQNGFYHSPAAGAPPAYELPDNPPEGSRIVYSVGNVPTAPNFEARVLEITTGTGVLVTVDENTGEWTAFPTGHITSFPSNGGGDNGQASRNFYIHAHNVAAPPETLGGLPVPAGENAQVDALFTRMYIIADNTISDVVDEQLTGYAGRGRNELFIGTGGDDDIGTTRGGTDVIFARVGDDTFTLGRHDSDTIYHRFSSSDSDWVNTDGGDTISNYVRSGADNANDTFIFIDTDSDTVATEDDFAGQDNIEFWANIGLDGATLEIEGFEIRFVGPISGTLESTITINYHMEHRPDITTNAQKDAFGIENTVVAAGPQEIVDGTKFGHYFGETPDAFQVLDDGDLPLAIASIVADVI